MLRVILACLATSLFALALATPVLSETIPLKSDGGTFVVPVVINDKITLNFTLDSGAAAVSIPADVFSTLVRTGTILKSDYLDTQVYELADGTKTRSQRFHIRSLKVGGIELRNVTASVAPTAGSLLLGQSFLSRLGSWAIDNRRHVLVINESAGIPTADTPNTDDPERRLAHDGVDIYSTSYSLGVSMGDQLRKNGVAADAVLSERLAQGVRDGISGNAKLSEADRASIKELIQKSHAAAVADAQPNSYRLGVSMGQQLRDNAVAPDAVNSQRLAQGVRDALTGEVKISEADKKNIQQLVSNASARAAETNHRAAAQFLAENGKKPGVVTTASGLQYKVLAAGSGESPNATDEVTVNYRGTLLDGTEFDSSYKRGQPATFVLGRVIPGWTEGLQLMKPGADYQLFVPPQLAYDLHGRPPIPPGSMLIFEVRLIAVKRH